MSYRVFFIDTGVQETIDAKELMATNIEQKDGYAKCFVLDDIVQRLT